MRAIFQASACTEKLNQLSGRLRQAGEAAIVKEVQRLDGRSNAGVEAEIVGGGRYGTARFALACFTDSSGDGAAARRRQLSLPVGEDDVEHSAAARVRLRRGRRDLLADEPIRLQQNDGSLSICIINMTINIGLAAMD